MYACIACDANNALRASQALLKCADFLAEQHDQVAASLVNEVAEPMKQLQKSQEATRSTILTDIAKQNLGHQRELDALSKVQKKCDKAEKDAEAARLAYDKVGGETAARRDQHITLWMEAHVHARHA